MSFRLWSFLKAIKKLVIICVVRESRSYICYWRYTIWGTSGIQAERNEKKKDLLNRKRSLIVVICYAINLGVRSFSLPVYTLNAVLMQRFATEVNSFIHLTCALISYFVFRNGEIRVMNTLIWISKILSACL